MLACDGNLQRRRDLIGIQAGWDQSFVTDDDNEKVMGRCQKLRYRNVTETCYTNLLVTNCGSLTVERYGERRNSSIITSINFRPSEEVVQNRIYFNFPSAADVALVGTGDASLQVPVRADQSPMSPRAHAGDSPSPSAAAAAADVALLRLEASGFYHGRISPAKARQLLLPHSTGTFLVRASSDPRFICSLTVRTCSVGRETTSVRIELLETGEFRLDGEHPGAHLLPSSPCVLDLLRRHMAARGGPERPGFVFLSGKGSGREIPMVLRQPLYRDAGPASLKHLCRRAMHSLLDGRSVERLHLVPSLKHYLKDYPSAL